MKNIWKRTEEGKLVYIPTDDGKFEAWADENLDWHVANSSQIECWRAIWNAARRCYQEAE